MQVGSAFRLGEQWVKPHQSFAVLVDEVLRGFGPFGKNDVVHSLLRDLQATQVEV